MNPQISQICRDYGQSQTGSSSSCSSLVLGRILPPRTSRRTRTRTKISLLRQGFGAGGKLIETKTSKQKTAKEAKRGRGLFCQNTLLCHELL